MSPSTTKPVPPAKFGTLLGVAPGGTAVYSSDYKSADDQELPNRHAYRSYIDDVFMGYKWQCVELARRWLYQNRGYVFDDVAMAHEIFRLRAVRRVADGELLPLRSFRNGSRRPPEPGCLLIWDEGGEFENTGHVAVVTEVFPDRVRIVEQNYVHHVWPDGQHFSREIPARIAADGGFWMRCAYREGTLLGWVVQTEDDRWAEPVRDTNPGLFAIQMAEAADRGQTEVSWLNEGNPEEATFVELMKGHRLADDPGSLFKYLRISQTAQDELERATNALHALFLHATDYVLESDERLARFNIPPALWPRIHQSWDNRRNQMITGRFDFALTEHGLKAYEYNADSASCHLECGKVQGLWSAHFGCEEGSCPGDGLFEELIEAWRDSGVDSLLHVMHDRDLEETAHALYMRSALEAAGIPTKVLLGLDGLTWGPGGTILDPDGEEIRWVWKTWAWETALDQIRAECEDDEQRLREYRASQPSEQAPRLVDVLLRPGVRVFEPLWTLIPSNKAILPILWRLFPNHPYLLETHYELTEGLRAAGYVEKPIAGRCGNNISLFDANQEVVAETAGRFEHQDQIYQGLFSLPRAGGTNVQLSTFSVAGTYVGTCARVDPSRVITWKSDILALRVLSDREFLSAREPERGSTDS